MASFPAPAAGRRVRLLWHERTRTRHRASTVRGRGSSSRRPALARPRCCACDIVRSPPRSRKRISRSRQLRGAGAQVADRLDRPAGETVLPGGERSGSRRRRIGGKGPAWARPTDARATDVTERRANDFGAIPSPDHVSGVRPHLRNRAAHAPPGPPTAVLQSSVGVVPVRCPAAGCRYSPGTMRPGRPGANASYRLLHHVSAPDRRPFRASPCVSTAGAGPERPWPIPLAATWSSGLPHARTFRHGVTVSPRGVTADPRPNGEVPQRWSPGRCRTRPAGWATQGAVRGDARTAKVKAKDEVSEVLRAGQDPAQYREVRARAPGHSRSGDRTGPRDEA